MTHSPVAPRPPIWFHLSGVTGGKSVSLNVRTDPSIIGGIVVKLGSRMVDASVRTKLNSIRTRMKEVG